MKRVLRRIKDSSKQLKAIERTPIYAPNCFGKLFFDPNGEQCVFYDCSLWNLCQQEISLNGKFVGKVGGLIDVSPTVGEQLFSWLKEELKEYFWFNTRKKFYNVVVLGHEDKWRYRYLRIWLTHKGIRIDMCLSLSDEFEDLNWSIRPFKEYRKKTFRPHVGAVKIRDKDILKRFLRIFIRWAKYREFKAILENFDGHDEMPCTIS